MNTDTAELLEALEQFGEQQLEALGDKACLLQQRQFKRQPKLATLRRVRAPLRKAQVLLL